MAPKLMPLLMTAGLVFAVRGEVSAGASVQSRGRNARSLVRVATKASESDGPGTQTVYLAKGGYGADVNLLASSSHLAHHAATGRLTKGERVKVAQPVTPEGTDAAAELRQEVEQADAITKELAEGEHNALVSKNLVAALEADKRKLSQELEDKTAQLEEEKQLTGEERQAVSQAQERLTAAEQEDAKREQEIAQKARQANEALKQEVDKATKGASAALKARDRAEHELAQSKALLTRERRRSASLKQKEAALEQKEATLVQKNAALEQKEAALEQKNAALEQKNAALGHRRKAAAASARETAPARAPQRPTAVSTGRPPLAHRSHRVEAQAEEDAEEPDSDATPIQVFAEPARALPVAVAPPLRALSAFPRAPAPAPVHHGRRVKAGVRIPRNEEAEDEDEEPDNDAAPIQVFAEPPRALPVAAAKLPRRVRVVAAAHGASAAAKRRRTSAEPGADAEPRAAGDAPEQPETVQPEEPDIDPEAMAASAPEVSAAAEAELDRADAEVDNERKQEVMEYKDVQTLESDDDDMDFQEPLGWNN